MVGYKYAAISAAVAIGGKGYHVAAFQDKTLHRIGLYAKIVVLAYAVVGSFAGIKLTTEDGERLYACGVRDNGCSIKIDGCTVVGLQLCFGAVDGDGLVEQHCAGHSHILQQVNGVVSLGSCQSFCQGCIATVIYLCLEDGNAILGEAPSEEIVKQITETVDRYEGALGIHDMVVHNYGPGRIIASLHIEVDGSIDVFKTHDMIDTIEKDLRENGGIEATIHMDPIVTDDEQVNKLRAKTAEAVKKIHTSMQIHDFRFVAGATHTNLIFDVVVPFEVKMSEAEVKAAVAEKVKEIDPTYCVVLNVDHA